MNEQGPNAADALLDRQKQAWEEGKRISVEGFLEGTPFETDHEIFLDLLYHEIVLREERGESPCVTEYVRQYPHFREDLEIHFEVHRAVRDNLLLDTPRGLDDESLPDLTDSPRNAAPTFKDYECLAMLGQGGMGVVYKARHRQLNRFVALKMFQPGRTPSPRELHRFNTEAEAVARLQHPNIVQIFEIGQSEGLPFLALELAEQGTLAQKLQKLPFAPRAAAELVEILASAVHHAHERNILHRDLKPANVLFTRDGTPKITDFGLAKILEQAGNLACDATRTGEPMGTPRYMAPEQAAGRADQAGATTDVYGLGNLLYECLTGQAPFVAASALETMEKIRRDQPLSLRKLQRSVPRDLETICLTCLHKQPGRRYQSALALAEDLRRFLQRKPIHARPTATWERGWMWCRRHPTGAALMAVGLLLGFAALTGYGAQQQVERQRLAGLRAEVAELVKEGQEAFAREDNRTAQTRFLTAWAKIRSEPSLYDFELGVSGWLDHTRREAEQQRWKERRPPPLFDELRDEAFLHGALFVPYQEGTVRAARESIQAALALTLPDDPAWHLEREQLILLDADLVMREGNAERALALLDAVKAHSSRLWHERRAECLERLGRRQEATRERLSARQLPPKKPVEWFLSGIDRFGRHDVAAALGDFEKVLTLEPDHFTGRFFQGACFLRLKRPAEAKVAMTACLGQRPRFVWNYLLRGRASMQLGDSSSAGEDFLRALNGQPNEATRFAALIHLGGLHLHLGQWDQARTRLETACRLMPGHYASWLHLGRAYCGQKQWGPAEKHLSRAITLQPRWAGGYRERAACHRGQSRWREALADLDRALEWEQIDSPLRKADQLERAKVLVRLGRLDEAIRSGVKALWTGKR